MTTDFKVFTSFHLSFHCKMLYVFRHLSKKVKSVKAIYRKRFLEKRNLNFKITLLQKEDLKTISQLSLSLSKQAISLAFSVVKASNITLKGVKAHANKNIIIKIS